MAYKRKYPDYVEYNVYDVNIGDVFMINYYGILVFFLICKTKTDTVYIAELETKQVEVDGTIYDTVTDKYPSYPYIVKYKNTYRKTVFEIEPVLIKEEPYLPINVQMNSRLHNAAKKKVECPNWGIVYAKKIEGDPYNILFRREDYDA